MTYFTVLLITLLGGPLDGAVTGLVFPSEVECMAAHRTISRMLTYDHSIECRVTDTASGSIRPRARP